ncbi:MAG: S41 family peptidase [Gemmatimonadaceae bacterium]|nr:S41 family peptidase [Gemmatimonadaceae bacterium]
MTSLRKQPLALVIVALACARAPVSTSPAASAISIDTALAAATFDTAWTTIHRTYYDTTFRGIDWPGVRAELRPRAVSARTVGELRTVIRSMLARMGESHFGLIPAEIVKATGDADEDESDGGAGDVGIEIRIVHGDPVVWRVDSAGPAFAAGVRTGWIIEKVDGFSGRPAIAAALALPRPRDRSEALSLAGARLRQRLTGDPGTTVNVELADGMGRRVRLPLTRRSEPGQIARFGNLPPLNVQLTRSRLPAVGSCVGYVAFNIWLTPISAAFDSTMQELSDCRGIVLDLRGNPGGIAGLSMGIAGYFVDTIVPLGMLKTRENELRLVTNPRTVSFSGRPVRVYDRPLAILVDRQSVSTSEIFAAGMQYLRRARVFGDTTSGQALPALMKRLPNDDVLLHVFSDYKLPDGTRLEVRGVIPDQVEPVSRADLLAGRDAALLAALRWIEGQ